MTKQNEIQLTPKWIKIVQKVGSVFFALLFLLNVWILILKTIETETNVILGAVGSFLVLSFLATQFICISSAAIVEDKIILKKLLKPAKSYPVNDISSIEAVGFKHIKYIKVTMSNNGKPDEYLIISTQLIAEFENKDAEQVLMSLWNSNLSS
jgi:membrane-anchored protein YejM (alkaline phosphatase superfamily)